MLLRSEEFQTEDGVRMIREFYGERGSEGEEIVTTTHERPADAELVVDNIAKETTLTAVKNAVGTSDDTEVESTLFGKLAQLTKLVPEKLAEVVGKITNLDTKIGESGNTEESASLFGKLSKIENSVSPRQYSPSNTVVATLNTDNIGSSGTGTKLVLKRKAEYSGTVRIKIGSAVGGDSKPIRLFVFSGSSLSTSELTPSAAQALFNITKATEGTQISNVLTSAGVSGVMSIDITSGLNDVNLDLYVHKGEYFYMLCSWSSAYVGYYVKNVTLCYDII